MRVFLNVLNLIESVRYKSRSWLSKNRVLFVSDFVFFSLRERVHIFLSKLEFSATQMNKGKDAHLVHSLGFPIHDTTYSVLLRPSPPVTTERNIALVSSLSECRDEGVVLHDKIADSGTVVLSEDSIFTGVLGFNSHKEVVHEEEVLVTTLNIVTNQNSVVALSHFCICLKPRPRNVSYMEVRSFPHQDFLRVRRKSEVLADL